MSYEDKAIVSEWMDHLKNLNVKVKKEQFRINVIHFTESYEKYVGFRKVNDIGSAPSLTHNPND